MLKKMFPQLSGSNEVSPMSVSCSPKDPILETIAGLVDEVFEMLGNGEAGLCLSSFFMHRAGSLDTGRFSSRPGL